MLLDLRSRSIKEKGISSTTIKLPVQQNDIEEARKTIATDLQPTFDSFLPLYS